MAAETRAPPLVSGLHLVYWSSCWRGRAVLTMAGERPLHVYWVCVASTCTRWRLPIYLSCWRRPCCRGGFRFALDEAQRAGARTRPRGSGPRRSASQTRPRSARVAPSFPRGESQRRAAPEL